MARAKPKAEKKYCPRDAAADGKKSSRARSKREYKSPADSNLATTKIGRFCCSSFIYLALFSLSASFSPSILSNDCRDAGSTRELPLHCSELNTAIGHDALVLHFWPPSAIYSDACDEIYIYIYTQLFQTGGKKKKKKTWKHCYLGKPVCEIWPHACDACFLRAAGGVCEWWIGFLNFENFSEYCDDKVFFRDIMLIRRGISGLVGKVDYVVLNSCDIVGKEIL